MNSTRTIEQLIGDWLDESDVQEVSKQSYRLKIHYWFRWLAAARRRIDAPTKADILAYKAAITADGKTEMTVAGYVRVVKLFYKWTALRQIYPNVAIEVRCTISQRGHRKSALTARQASELLDSIDIKRPSGLRDKLAIMMMLHLGLRTVELERMNLGDITTIDGFPVVYVQRKGRREKREALELTKGVCELMADYIGEREIADDAPLFEANSIKWSATPKRLHRKDLTRIVKQRLRAIGIDSPKITAHSLRHTCASLLLKSGVSIETIRDLLGHTSTDTTRIYLADIISSELISNSPSKNVEKIINSERLCE